MMRWWLQPLLLLALAACGAQPTPTLAPPPPPAETPTRFPTATLWMPPTAEPATRAPASGPGPSAAPPSVTPATPAPLEATPDAPLIGGGGEATPAMGVCPTPGPDPGGVLDFINYSDEFIFSGGLLRVEQRTLETLNSAGPAPLLRSLRAAGREEGRHFFHQDITGDGVPELAFGLVVFYVFGCRDGQYATLLRLQGDNVHNVPSLQALEDMNLDGRPELALSVAGCGGDCLMAWVFGWNGTAFESLVAGEFGDFALMRGHRRLGRFALSTGDLDGNGTVEIVLKGGVPQTVALGGPWRERWDYYGWDGTRFALTRSTLGTPEYRFQAVQDADQAALDGAHDVALALYQQVIYDGGLDWWSPEKAVHFATQRRAGLGGTPTPNALPLDGTEREQLSAYARFRILLLHALDGQLDGADTIYRALLETYPEGSPGYPYAALAELFWTAYQATGSVVAGCDAAVAHAAEHPELLQPLGSAYHGEQSRLYSPRDICPFEA
jgi:hypothetical protein